MPTPPTLSDLARASGLDKSTISRALRGDPRVKVDTREQVRKLAQTLGYVANPVLASLGRRGAKGAPPILRVALLLDQKPEQTHVGDMSLYDLLVERGRPMGYAVEVFHRTDFANVAELQRHLIRGGFRQLILGPSYREVESASLDFEQFVAIALHQGMHRPPLHVVELDYYGMVERCWHEALARGYRRIAPVLYRHEVPVRDDSLRSAAIEHLQRLAPRESHIPIYWYNGWFDLEGLTDHVRGYRPDCILAFNDLPLHQLRLRGLNIPEELGYISLHVMPWNQGLAGLRYQGSDEVDAALKLLDYAVRTNQWGTPHPRIVHQVMPEWREGSSVRAVPA